VLPISDMGGLSLVEAAKKLGMEISAGQPTVLAYLGLNDMSSAQLLLYNYTLFRGVGLIVLDPPSQPLVYAERLRCLYASIANKTQVIDTLRTIYRGLLNNVSNPYAVLPNSTCLVDVSSESALLSLALTGLNMPDQTASLPVLIVVYPNGTYTAITGYNPSALKAALGG
ncbi:MAG: protein-disulfide isomerase, partial [Thermoproteus sp.]